MRLTKSTKELSEDIERFVTMAFRSDKSKESMVRIHKKIWPESEISDATRHVYAKDIMTHSKEWITLNLGSEQDQIDLYKENYNKLVGWIDTFEAEGKMNTTATVAYIREANRMQEKIIELEAKLHGGGNSKGIWDKYIDDHQRMKFALRVNPQSVLLDERADYHGNQISRPYFEFITLESKDGEKEIIRRPNLDDYEIEVFIKAKTAD